MTFYRVSYVTASGFLCFEWFSDHIEARDSVMQLKLDAHKALFSDIAMDVFSINDTAEALVAWLNKHFTKEG